MRYLKLFAAVLLGLSAAGLATGHVALLGRSVEMVAFATAQYDETLRGLTGGTSALLNDGIPLCDSAFATKLVRDAVDRSPLVTASASHAPAADLMQIVPILVDKVSVDKGRACRGTVVFQDGTFAAVRYTIVPRGFHNFVIKASAAPPARPPRAAVKS